MNSIIAAMEKYDLGLTRDGAVTLQPHNPLWQEAASSEIGRVSNEIGNKFSFYHIGSTSIPGICAKPILDILIIAPSLKEIDSCKKKFISLGYEYKGEYGISGRRYCVLYNDEKTKGYVHIHAFEAGNIEVERHLRFQDYLRAVPEVAERYHQLKLGLISDKNMKRSDYTEAKAPFIKSALSEAYEWQKLK